MKKNIFIIAILFVVILLTSCTSTAYVHSKDSYKTTTDKIKNELSAYGYTFYGVKTDAYYYTNQEFIFKDNDGNEVSFNLKYKEGDDYIAPIEVTGCSAGKNHDEICGDNGIVKSNINELNKDPDKTVRVFSVGKTVGASIGGIVALSVLIGILSVL